MLISFDRLECLLTPAASERRVIHFTALEHHERWQFLMQHDQPSAYAMKSYDITVLSSRRVFTFMLVVAGMLQEYERHLEEGHPDRGDTQRSIHVYNEITVRNTLPQRDHGTVYTLRQRDHGRCWSYRPSEHHGVELLALTWL